MGLNVPRRELSRIQHPRSVTDKVIDRRKRNETQQNLNTKTKMTKTPRRAMCRAAVTAVAAGNIV